MTISYKQLTAEHDSIRHAAYNILEDVSVNISAHRRSTWLKVQDLAGLVAEHIKHEDSALGGLIDNPFLQGGGPEWNLAFSQLHDFRIRWSVFIDRWDLPAALEHWYEFRLHVRHILLNIGEVLEAETSVLYKQALKETAISLR